MSAGLLGLLDLLSWKDLLDVAVVTLLYYNLLLLIRGTRAVQMLLGILTIAVLFFVARLANLVTLEALMDNFLIFLPFAVIVLFQHEIRRALARFGRNPLLSRSSRPHIEATIDEIVLACSAMAARKIGALLVVERQEGLRNYAESGIRLDARLSFDLLVNLFTPGTPLHDGAAIVQGDRIASAACFLPLSSSHELTKDFGTRHRAAVGISEETDALAVVVSEESGRISLAVGGQLLRDLDAAALRRELGERLAVDPHRHAKEVA